jgi:uncharacterized BrkB/YihY/UPF0761 family membrane protein
LADLSQFFSILSGLNIIGAASQALQIIFEMQNQRSSPKKSSKKNTFFEIAKCIFFLILTPPTSSVHNFLIFFFKLSDLNCSDIAILSSTIHLATLKATK